jgi:spermidine synthase
MSEKHGGVASPGAPIGRLELYATVFVCGAAVMVLEILGTRIIGPVFGVSLFVWTALLAVTLASLAAGYYGGGVLVDRKPERRTLGLAVLVAGLAVGITPAISGAVLAMTDGLGPRAGSLLSAAILFGPSLVVLGAVGPIAIRLSIRDLSGTGHRVGGMYAVSTGGSLLGTLVTSFVLIPSLETKYILMGTAVLLIALGAVPLARSGRPAALAAVLVPALGLTSTGSSLPSGITILDQAHSPYGVVQVIDDANRGVRLLRADHSIIGAQIKDGAYAAFAFLHQLEVLRFMRPQAKDLLQIGLGIGSLPVALKRYGIKADVVEIDPAVVQFAKDYFGFSTTGDSIVEDARTYLQRTDRRYDLIVHDTFTGGATPEHLLSIEVLRRIKAILRPGGVLALNFVGYDTGPHAEAAYAVARTVRAVFPTVRVFRDSAPEHSSVGNLTFFATDSTLDFRIPDGATFENETCENAQRSFTSWEVLRQVPDGPLITDARNPLARLQLASAENHYAAMRKLLPPAVWLIQ